MRLKRYINRFKRNYIINKVARAKPPKFSSSDIIRQRVIFSGKVQNVGFRYEIYHLASKIELTGWVKNLDNGTVKMEAQGSHERIEFLIKHMKELKRASVEEISVDEVPAIEKENEFKIVI